MKEELIIMAVSVALVLACAYNLAATYVLQ
jgi:hypothetical protein